MTEVSYANVFAPLPCACCKRLRLRGLRHPAGCLVIAGLTTYLFFPETSGIPVEMTHSVFKDHWAWPRMYPEILQARLLPQLQMPARGYFHWS